MFILPLNSPVVGFIFTVTVYGSFSSIAGDAGGADVSDDAGGADVSDDAGGADESLPLLLNSYPLSGVSRNL